MDAQTLVALLIVALALLYLVRRAVRGGGAKRPECAHCAGCRPAFRAITAKPRSAELPGLERHRAHR